MFVMVETEVANYLKEIMCKSVNKDIVCKIK